MKLRKIGIIVSLVLVIGLAALWKLPSDAKQVGFQVVTANETVAKGNDVTVDLTVTGDVKFRSVEAYMKYDASVLDFKAASSEAITGSTGLLRLSDFFDAGTSKVSYSITFTALEVGKSTFKIQEMNVEEETDLEVTTVDNTTATVTVRNNQEESQDAKLESLEVYPGTLSPEFSGDVYSYQVSVGKEDTDLVLSAIPSDSSSVVTVEGNENFTAGANMITITVTSVSGAKKQYKICAEKAE